MNACFATIISANYLAYAAVLANSIAEHSPDTSLEVLIVDTPTPEVRRAAESLRLNVTFASELSLQGFTQLAYRYDLVELNTALKATFLKALLARSFGRVVYLDPDICLYSSPAPIFSKLAESEIVLIPHALAPAMDGMRPSDIDFLRLGSFNLGFIGVRSGSESARFLNWWEQRCLTYGNNDPTFGLFVDQKWIDLVPSYFDQVAILKHRGCNVAYWNLHERTVSNVAGRYQIGDEPLVFFHFSGVKANDPTQLSRHQNRHTLAPGSVLAALVKNYCDKLNAAGHLSYAAIPYGYGRLTDGTPINAVMRRASTVSGIGQDDPFDPDTPLQCSLKRAGISVRGTTMKQAVAETTLNFDAQDRRVIAVNWLVRIASRAFGVARVELMLRYATFLVWQGNYPAVLLKRPFTLEHGSAAQTDPQGELVESSRQRD